MIWVHTLTACLALAVGFFVFIDTKGTEQHKLLGRIFAALMFTCLVSSFFIQADGQLSFLHILSALGTYSLIKAILSVVLKRNKNWRYIHASNMVTAYISIIIAGAGVLGRHIIFPGHDDYGFIISACVALPVIFLSKKKLNQHFNQ